MTPRTVHLAELAGSVALEELLRDRWPDVQVGPLAKRISGAARALVDEAGADTPSVAVYAPGRIEFLGKHTDYAGGRSLTCAVRRAFCMVAARSGAAGVSLFDQVSGTRVFVPYVSDGAEFEHHWSVYPRAVVNRYVANFGAPPFGIALAFNSDIPRASGMSSSSAFVVGIWLAIAALAGVHARPPFRDNIRSAADLAGYLGSVENGAAFGPLAGDDGVGTRGGEQDHAAILFSRRRSLGHYAYRPLRRIGATELAPELTFVIASSGVHASKTGGAQRDYNRAVRLAERIPEVWRAETGGSERTMEEVISSPDYSEAVLESMLRSHEQDGDDLTALLSRVEQYVLETREIIPGAVEALDAGDLKRVGLLVALSQRLADEKLENQIPETRFLVESALDCGAVAASAFGAGFGGSVYALVESHNADRLLRDWVAAYGSRFESQLRRACFFEDPTGPGAFVLGTDPALLLLEPEL